MSGKHMDYTPSASLNNACERAAIYSRVRTFFARRGILEVETPILSHAGVTDVYLQSVKAKFKQYDQDCTGYLHTSPEFAMKRLLAAWKLPIYQISKVFRDNELGKKHNIEFTMLEWYQPHGTLDSLIIELNELINQIFKTKTIFQRISYQQAFIDHAFIDPFNANLNDLEQTARYFGIQSNLYRSIDALNVMNSQQSVALKNANNTMAINQHPTHTTQVHYQNFNHHYELVGRTYPNIKGHAFNVLGTLQKKESIKSIPHANHADNSMTNHTSKAHTSTKQTTAEPTLTVIERKQAWLDLLFSHIVEPALGHDVPTVIYDFPAGQASLAKVAKDEAGNMVAKRFELYIKGLEIANAYDELIDSEEQKLRFELDNDERQEKGFATIPIDTNLLAALKDMPESVGIAVGMDRLIMLACQTNDIKEVINFTTDKA